VTTRTIIGRAFAFAWPLRHRFAVKAGLMLAALGPIVLLPWPAKILVDHVILGAPIDRPVRPYPWFVAWATDALAGAPVETILAWTIVAQVALLLLVGAFGTLGPELATTDASLAGGEDLASSTENYANGGTSTVGGLLGLLETRFTMRLTQDLNHAFRRRLFERLLHAPAWRLDERRLGDTVFRVLYDTPGITLTCYLLLLTPIVAPASIAVALVMIRLVFGDAPELFFGAAVFLPVGFVITWPFARMLRRAAETTRTAGATTTAGVVDGLDRIAAVQGLGAEAQERDAFAARSADGFRTYRRMVLIGVSAALVSFVVGIAFAARTFLQVVDLVIAGTLTVGDVGLLFSYYGQVILGVVAISTCWIRIQTSLAGLGRVFVALEAPTEAEGHGTAPAPTAPAAVRFDHVRVTYPDGTVALRDVSCDVRRGELTVIVGPAGAGKTTLMHLLCAFVVPTEGRVLIDDRDVRTLDPASLRQRLGIVFQEPGLLAGTIADNVRLGRTAPSDADVDRAATLAGLDDVIRSLPAGIASDVGRGGMKLSVGQRHRVALARAVLSDPPILVLDEPTAALDVASERRLVDHLRAQARTRIVLVISHRLAVAQAADRVIVLEDGCVVESGSPRELAARPDGAYRRALALQQGVVA
jgi:ABC-type multidrug transport system fused ATPase/permease subunit